MAQLQGLAQRQSRPGENALDPGLCLQIIGQSASTTAPDLAGLVGRPTSSIVKAHPQDDRFGFRAIERGHRVIEYT